MSVLRFIIYGCKIINTNLTAKIITLLSCHLLQLIGMITKSTSCPFNSTLIIIKSHPILSYLYSFHNLLTKFKLYQKLSIYITITIDKSPLTAYIIMSYGFINLLITDKVFCRKSPRNSQYLIICHNFLSADKWIMILDLV